MSTNQLVCGRQTGNYPETGLGEIDGDVLEADFSLLFLLEPSEIRKINKTDIFS